MKQLKPIARHHTINPQTASHHQPREFSSHVFSHHLTASRTPPFAGDRSLFSEQFTAIRQAAPDSTRFVLVTATVPEETFEHLSQTEFPGMKVAFGPRLHRPSSGGHDRLLSLVIV